MRVRARELGVAALERLDHYGMEDRREAAFNLLLGAAAPLLGMTLLGWPPKTAMFSLLINLLLALLDDLVKIAQSRGRWAQALKDRVEDEFVWPMARLMLRRRSVTYLRDLPNEIDLAQGRSNTPLAATIPFAFVTTGLTMLLLQADGEIYAQHDALLLGSIPSVLLIVAVSWLHRFNRHRDWRLAGSVRAQTTGHTALMVGYLGGAGYSCSVCRRIRRSPTCSWRASSAPSSSPTACSASGSCCGCGNPRASCGSRSGRWVCGSLPRRRDAGPCGSGYPRGGSQR
jgi:hypothetical protein